MISLIPLTGPGLRYFHLILASFWHTLIALALGAILVGSPGPVKGQHLLEPSDTLHRTRLKGLALGTGAMYGVSLIGLNELWYAQYERSGFHFVNERRHWQQMDKAGHAFTAYYESVAAYHLLRWSGLEASKSRWYGGLAGFMLQTPIEVLDGFSRKWGAAPGDIVANAMGSALFIAQQAGWQAQILRLKFSHNPTPFPEHKPELLGSNPLQQVIKDYNSQTYWLALPVNQLIPGAKPLPPWLDLAAGYGATGMLGSQQNPREFVNQPRYRQYSLALDIDVSHFETGSRLINSLLDALSVLKVPLPGLQYSQVKGLQPQAITY